MCTILRLTIGVEYVIIYTSRGGGPKLDSRPGQVNFFLFIVNDNKVCVYNACVVNVS